MLSDVDLIDGIVVIFRKCWNLPHDATEDELKSHALLLLNWFKGGASEVDMDVEVAKVQLRLGLGFDKSHEDVTARIIDLVGRDSIRSTHPG